MRKFTKLMAALALLLFMTPAMVGWGQTTVTQTSFTAISGNVNNDTKVSYAAYKGGGTSNPAVNTNAIRLYQNSNGQTGGYVVIGVTSGYQITSATIQSTMATTTGYKLTDIDPGSTTPAKNTFNVSNYSLSANTDYTVSNISTQYITFACFGTSSSSRLYLSKISVTYESTGSQTTTYTVTYHANVTGIADIVETYNEGATVTIADNTFSNPGYAFTEWNTEADGSGDSYEPGDEIEDIEDDLELYAQWEESNDVVDVINPEFTGNPSSYTEWSNKQGTSGAVYAGQSTGGTNYVQLRATSPSGIVSTVSGGIVRKVVVTWNSSTVSGRTLNVYGKNTAYSTSADLYDDNAGTLLGTIVYGTSTELTITSDYEYIGIRSNDGAMYLDEIRISWEVSNDPACTVSPDIYDFENVAIGSTATQSFTVYTANLTEDLTLTMSELIYTVVPTTIEQNASSTQVTITFAPTSAGEAVASLIVNGSGFTNVEVALVSGTGVPVRTITFNAGNGTCGTQTMSGVDGATITLPTATPSTACAAAGWTFAGWSASNVTETTTAPTLLNDEYVINGDATLYAVYVLSEGEITTTNNVFTNGSYSNEVITWTLENCVVIVQEKNNGQTAPNELYINAPRWYAGNMITITPSVNVNSIIVTATSESYATALKNSTYTNASAAVSGTTVTITPTSGTAPITIVMGGQSRLSSLILNYGSFYYVYNSNPSCLEPVATPTFNPENGTIFSEDELEVSISCTTEDATIYYTLDGTDPTDESSVYGGAITLTGTTTVKAIAMKEGMADSEIAEAVYTHVSLMTIAAVRAQGTGNVVTKGIVTHMSGVTAYIQDETAAIVVYGSNVPTVGDEIRVSGTLTSFKGLLEIGSNNNPPVITVLSQGNTIEPTVMTIEAINTDAGGNNAYQAKLVRIENATYNNGTVSQGENSITVYGTMAGVNDGNIVSFTGNIGCYNSVQIVNPTDIIVSYKLSITAFSAGGYRLIASPIGTVDPKKVTNMIDNTLDANGRYPYDLFRFDQNPSDGKEWRNYRNTDGGNFNLEVGKGYLYGNLNEVELAFMGTGFTTTDGTYAVDLAYTSGAEFAGWNLVGNPFAVPATLDQPFYSMVDGAFVSNVVGATLPAMNGAFVVGSNDVTSVTFSRQTGNKAPMLALNLTEDGKLLDRAIVSFGEGRQLPKFQLFKNSTKLYITQDGQDYAVVCSEEMGETPVNFKAEENGTYTLSFSTENVGFAYLHLVDNMTGRDIDLLQTPSYSFEAKTTDYESRFKLVFATGDNSTNDTFAFFSNGSFVINNEGNATLQVIDITGRIIKSESINGCANVNVNAAPGVYMLRLVNGDNVKVQKVVIR